MKVTLKPFSHFASIRMLGACRTILILLFTSLAATPAFSQTSTDVESTVASLLSAYGPVPVSRTVNQCRIECFPGGGNVKDKCGKTCEDVVLQTNEILTASNLRIVVLAPIQFGEVKVIEFPGNVSMKSTAYYNCTSTNATYIDTLQLTFQRTTTSQVTKTIQHAQSNQVGFQWKPLESITLTGQVQISDQATTATMNGSSYAESVAMTSQTNIVLAPSRAAKATLETWPIEYSTTFSTTALVDADLSANDKSLKALSDVIDAAHRTFQVNGIIQFSDAHDGKSFTVDIPFDIKQCANDSNTKSVFVRKPLSR